MGTRWWVGEFNRVQDVCVEHHDWGRHAWVSSVVQTEFLGLLGQFFKGLLRGDVLAVSVGENIDQPNAAMGANQVKRYGAGLAELDDVGSTDVEQLGGFEQREFGR